MGTDDLFKKRKSRNAKSTKRRGEVRESYDKVLIVCEGEKTEAFYMLALRDHLGLSQANIEIDPNSDSSPTSVVAYAKKLIVENRTDPYNHAYCIIDRDEHADYQKAVDQVNGYRNKETKLHLIVSDPCFEYWILLHYTYTTKVFGTSGGSPCKELISQELKQYIADYEKGDASIMQGLVEGQLTTALVHAARSEKAAKIAGVDSPRTQMHMLVNYLKQLKD